MRTKTSPNKRDVEILAAVENGCETVQEIRVPLKIDSVDALRTRCSWLVSKGFLISWLDRAPRPQGGGLGYGHRSKIRRYALTDSGQRLVRRPDAQAV